MLVPSAIVLDQLASARAFDGWYALFQALELWAGAFNLVLMSWNLRDGLVLAGRRKQVPSRARTAA